MADTARTKAALAALLADNISADISPQDVRDFLETMNPSFGSLYWSATAATTIAVQSTYYKALGTTTAINLNRFTSPASNRLTYTGDPDIHLHIACSMSCTCASNSQILGFSIGINGTHIPASLIQRKVGTGADVGALALHWDAQLSTNDYIELFVTNDSGTATVTIEQGYLFAMSMMV
jgi:hypothetical protein